MSIYYDLGQVVGPQGPQGPQGPPGPQGPAGPGGGLPSGGSVGQVLTKTADGAAWADPAGGSGKQDKITASGLLKGNGNGGVSAAVAGTDYQAPLTASAFGNIATFERITGGMPVNSLEVAISPKQAGSGDPSPSNVRAISGWTGANVYRAGKNLCVTPIVGKTYNITTGAYSDSSTTAASDKVKIDFSGGYITLSHHANIRCMIFAWDKNGTFIGRTTGKAPTGTNTVYTVAPTDFSSGSGSQEYTAIAYVAVRFYESSGESDPIATAMAAAYPQLEAGSTATTYEPYAGTTKSISFGQTVYGGRLNATTGELTVEWALFTAPQSATWSASSNNVFWLSKSDMAMGMSNVICDRYVNTAYGVSSMPDKSIRGHDSYDRIYIRDTGYSTASAFAASLSGAQILYKLATPITYQLTPVEVTTLLGENNIWADTGDVEVTFGEDVKAYVDSATGGKQDEVTTAGLLKGDGAGHISAAVAGTDYQTPLVAGTDYQEPLTLDTVPTSGSDNAITSGAVYTAILGAIGGSY